MYATNECACILTKQMCCVFCMCAHICMQVHECMKVKSWGWVSFSLCLPYVLRQDLIQSLVWLISCLCIYVCVPDTCSVLIEVRRGCQIPGTEVMDGCELSCWSRELNPGPLQYQLLLTIELSPALRETVLTQFSFSTCVHTSLSHQFLY